MSVTEILSQPDLINYIKDNLEDLWKGTFLQGYRYMDNKQKGNFGEKFAEKYLKSLNFKVSGRIDGDADHDMIVDNYKVEIKFSIAQTETNKKTGVKRLVKDRFMMNHVGIGKNYDRLIFIGINPNFEQSRIVWFDKNDLKKIIKNKDYFGFQQGGNAAKNDDYMSGSTRLMKLINSKYARTMEQW